MSSRRDLKRSIFYEIASSPSTSLRVSRKDRKTPEFLTLPELIFAIF